MARRVAKKAPDVDGTLARLVSYYEDSVSATVTSRQAAERDRDYYDNKQWTPEEVRKLEERGQAAIVINRIKPKIDFLLGTERQTRTDPHAFPRTPDDDESAEAATDALRYVADCNDFDQTRSETFENILIEGTGASVVEYVGNKVKIVWTPWDRFFHDPHSRKRDFSDAVYTGIVTWMDQAQVKAKWPDGGAEVWTATTDPETSTTFGDRPKSIWLDSNRTRIRIVEMYYLDGDTWMRAVYTAGGWLDKPAQSAYVDEDGQPVNPICAISAHVDRDNNRYGVVRQLVGVQDEINKRRSKALHLISSRQIVAERGAVDDIARAKKELAKPDGFIEVTPGMRFDPVETADMASGNMALLQEAKQEIDAVGANAALQGKQEGQQSGRALQSRQQSGLVELGPVFDSLRHWQRLVHRQVWYRIKQYWKEPMWVRVTDDEQSPKYVGLNQPMLTGDLELERLKKKRDPRARQLEQIWGQVKQSPDPMMAAQQAGIPQQFLQQTVQNDVGRMDMDIIIAEAPDTVNLQGEQFEQLTQMYQASLASPDPKDRIPFKLVLQASSLRNKDKLMSTLDGEDDEEAQRAQQEAAQKQQQYQEAGVQAELALKAADVELKRAQAAKTLKEAQISQEPAKQEVPDSLIKAHSAREVALIQGEVELRKTAMQQEAEKERHGMTLSLEGAKAEAEGHRAEKEQQTRSVEAQAANSDGQVQNVLGQLQEFVKELQGMKAQKSEETGQILMQGLTEAIKALGKPKKVVRGSDGRVAGLE